MYQGKTYEIYARLVDIALNKSKRTYEDFAQEVGLTLRGPSNDYHFLVEIAFESINGALHEYRDQQWTDGYPMLSAVIVKDYSTDAISGNGFFMCAHNLGLLSGWTSDPEEREFHARELSRVYSVQQWPDPVNLNLQSAILAE